MQHPISIIAPNIKNGGGLELLKYLIDVLENEYSLNVIVHIDSSLKQVICSTKKRKVVIYSTILKKVKLFFKSIDHSLYFGNLPPVVRSKNSILYIHNTYLTISLKKLYQTNFVFFIKYSLQQLYIKFFLNNCDVVACQTSTISKLIQKKFHPKKVEKLPFFRICDKKNLEKKYDFCYISLAHPHKNHLYLLDALESLAHKKIKLSIVLTVDEANIDLKNRIEKINSLNIVKIINLGIISKEEVCRVYNHSKCLIFPSSKESFGLPLIEAGNLGLDIIAPDLAYVDDVIRPTIKFDISDVNNLSKAIEMYIKNKDYKKVEVLVDSQLNKIIEYLVK